MQEEEAPKASRQQYADLVNTYDFHTLRRPEPTVKPEHMRLAPRLIITPEQEDRPPHKARQILEPIDDDHRQKIRRVKRLLTGWKPGLKSRRKWAAFVDLPTPRLRYIEDVVALKLFQHLAWVEKRDWDNSQRYFALLEEAVGERVPLRTGDWNTAISFAGRWVQKTTTDEVKAAIETWLRMEREGGKSANNITFNILFDVAVKGGRFALADTIYAEMERRGLELNRYFRTSKIYYAGKRGDAENVRAAFRELVAAGEIVDTAIMNCVIVSLVRCGEIASAENVVGKMKRLHEQKFGTDSIQDWRDKRAMGRLLDRSARQLREDENKHLSSFFGSPYSNDDKKEAIQRSAPIAPDELTYRILIQWHAYTSGNFEKIRGYVEEVQAAGWKVHHNVFYVLFAAFHKHGGYAFTAWNRKSLEAHWREYVQSVAGNAANEELAARLQDRVSKITATKERHEIYPLDPSDAIESSESEADAREELEDDDEDTDPPPSHLAPTQFRASTVRLALAAFYKCAGAKRMVEVWEEVQHEWSDMSDADRRNVESLVAENIKAAGMYVD